MNKLLRYASRRRAGPSGTPTPPGPDDFTASDFTADDFTPSDYSA